MKEIWFYDTETALIAPGRVAPPLVCLSWCDKKGHGLVKQAEAVRIYREKLLDDGVIIAAHNGPFDDCVMWQHDPSLRKLIWAKYDKGLMLCTQTFSKLHFIATREGFSFGNNFGLGAALDHFLDVKIEGKKGPDVWRTRYHELIDVAIEHWPEDAKAYALNDSIHGYNLVMTMLRAPKLFSTPLLDDKHTVWPDTVNQCRYAFAMYVMGCWGIRTNKERVDKLETYLRTEMKRLNAQLSQSGYLKPKGDGYSKNMKAIKAKVTELYDGLPPRGDITEKMKAKGITLGNVKTDSKETLPAIADLEPPVDMGTFYKCPETGLMVRHTPISDIQALIEREPLSKELSAFIPVLRQGTELPINPRWNVLVDTGRTSCGKPNLQQLPRRHGVRQCFEQRPGNIWFGADYSFAELCGLAQVQYNLFGKNSLMDVINADKYDPHVMMAANLAGISPEEGQRRHKAKDKRFKELRTLAKAANFGYPGGLGAKTFVDFAKATYGVILTIDEAKQLKDDWLRTYPEMRAYFDYIGTLTAGGSATIQQHWSGRVRGDTGFCNGSNGFFQGIIADGAKIGLYMVVRACYNEEDSPLFGARINAFIHDEILGECPPEQGHAAATELQRLMLEGIRTPVPDVLCKAEPYLSKVFDKDADTVRDKHGRLQLWQPKEVLTPAT